MADLVQVKGAAQLRVKGFWTDEDLTLWELSQWVAIQKLLKQAWGLEFIPFTRF